MANSVGKMICPACGGEFFHQTQLLDTCNICGLARTRNFKAPNYTHYHRDNQYQDDIPLLKNFFNHRYQLISRYVSGGKVIEAGCSIGTFLTLFKNRSWDVVGVEPSESFQVARKSGIPVFHSSWEKAKLPHDTFDLVVMSHVLEHVISPADFINKTYQILKPGGLLFIDLPNFGSFSAQIQKDTWPYLLPQEHRWHFTLSALNNLLSPNFEIIYYESRSGVWSMADPLSHFLTSLLSFKKSFFTDFIWLFPGLIASLFNRGTGLIVIARKVL